MQLNRYYIGLTEGSMSTRLHQHLSNHPGFTSKAKDWKIVYTEVYETKSQAMAREKQLKGWKSSTRVMELIKRSSIE